MNINSRFPEWRKSPAHSSTAYSTPVESRFDSWEITKLPAFDPKHMYKKTEVRDMKSDPAGYITDFYTYMYSQCLNYESTGLHQLLERRCLAEPSSRLVHDSFQKRLWRLPQEQLARRMTTAPGITSAVKNSLVAQNI